MVSGKERGLPQVAPKEPFVALPPRTIRYTTHRTPSRNRSIDDRIVGWSVMGDEEYPRCGVPVPWHTETTCTPSYMSLLMWSIGISLFLSPC